MGAVTFPAAAGPAFLADACPGCHPGDYPAVAPSAVACGGGSLRASYRHDACGRQWCCWWDAEAAGWPAPGAAEPLPPVIDGQGGLFSGDKEGR